MFIGGLLAQYTMEVNVLPETNLKIMTDVGGSSIIVDQSCNSAPLRLLTRVSI